MRKTCFTEDQIIGVLKDHDVLREDRGVVPAALNQRDNFDTIEGEFRADWTFLMHAS